jgi:hypothetical protein
LKARKKKRKKRKQSGKRLIRRTSHKQILKRAVKNAAKAIWKHLVELPEKEREQNLALIERELTRKFKRVTRRK